MDFDSNFEKVSDLVGRIRDYNKAASDHAHLRYWWRGQPDANWELLPGVYRPTFPEHDEPSRLEVERHLAQDFSVESAGLVETSDAMRLYFLQQHYGMPTRLLDWTTNALAALFFAVRDRDKLDRDGAVFFMDAYQLAVTQKTEPKGISTTHKWFNDALRRIFEWRNNLEFPKGIMAVRPAHADQRIGLQRSCFTFHVPDHPKLTVAENDSLLAFGIPSGAKTNILNDLVLLGLDEFSIYGDLDHLALRLRRAYRIP
jgi:hypothetical protein